ncbi:hypothetical protein [Xanthobacter versatilis]|uniref:hypothetical protein n=1 Tax=Xanthobacter autotrophicus (strain ATCC BAA-1158 / Py2) TaxID=78245 RepID=UPI003727BFC5
MAKNISGRTICAARGISPSAVDNFVRDYGFRTVDRSSGIPGKGRNWTYRDLLRLCLALRLHELGLAAFGSSELIPDLNDLPEGEKFVVVDIVDAGVDGDARVPHAAFVRIVAEITAAELFNDAHRQVTVIPFSVIEADAQVVLSFRASEEC